MSLWLINVRAIVWKYELNSLNFTSENFQQYSKLENSFDSTSMWNWWLIDDSVDHKVLVYCNSVISRWTNQICPQLVHNRKMWRISRIFQATISWGKRSLTSLENCWCLFENSIIAALEITLIIETNTVSTCFHIISWHRLVSISHLVRIFN